MRIALTGNPNSGKTTMFNALTGGNEKVGNWAGVTVEKKEHKLKRSFYNGKEDKNGLKWLFYAVYPLHLLALWLLNAYVF